MTEKRCDIGYI